MDLVGRLFRCQIAGADPDTWLPILGERSTRLSSERSNILTTSGSDTWRTGLGSGVGSHTFTVGGVALRSEAQRALSASLWNGTPVTVRIMSDLEAVIETQVIPGRLSFDADHDGVQMATWELIPVSSAAAEVPPVVVLPEAELWGFDEFSIAEDALVYRLADRGFPAFTVT